MEMKQKQILTFMRAHLLLSDANHQCVIAVAPGASPILYSTLEHGADAAAACAAVGARLRLLLQQEAEAAAAARRDGGGAARPPPALSAALSRALCYIHRHQRAAAGGGAAALLAAAGGGAGAGALADADADGGAPSASSAPKGVAGHAAHARRRAKPRILVISAAPDSPPQYIPTMNAIFSAQRAGAAVDAIALGGYDAAGAAAAAAAGGGGAGGSPAGGGSAYLQQAAHLTGGLYVRPSRPEALLQYLLTAFAADTATRAHLDIAQPAGVDYRASCFCHKRVVDTGFICSVCLSIFCKDNMRLAACPTCKSEFGARAGGGGGGAGGGAAARGGGGAAAAKGAGGG